MSFLATGAQAHRCLQHTRTYTRGSKCSHFADSDQSSSQSVSISRSHPALTPPTRLRLPFVQKCHEKATHMAASQSVSYFTVPPTWSHPALTPPPALNRLWPRICAWRIIVGIPNPQHESCVFRTSRPLATHTLRGDSHLTHIHSDGLLSKSIIIHTERSTPSRARFPLPVSRPHHTRGCPLGSRRLDRAIGHCQCQCHAHLSIQRTIARLGRVFSRPKREPCAAPPPHQPNDRTPRKELTNPSKGADEPLERS